MLSPRGHELSSYVPMYDRATGVKITWEQLTIYFYCLTSDLGYVSIRSVYRSKDCSRCPLRSMCYTGLHKTRIIVVNHRNNELRAMAWELLTSEEGLKHRSKRPIEPEAVFGQIKYDNHFKRFNYRGRRLVKAEFTAIAVAHNIRKMISKGYCVCSEVTVG